MKGKTEFQFLNIFATNSCVLIYTIYLYFTAVLDPEFVHCAAVCQKLLILHQ